MNEIVFPAGILQPPFFNAKADDAINYGGIGAVIAHEISHGFDDQGRQYDATGNLRDWWTPDAAAKYKERADKIIKQYAEYEPLPGLHINGELTQGENIADDGGVKLAYAALQKALKKKGGTPEKIDGAALLPGLGTGLAREYSRRSLEAAPQHRSAFADEVSLQRAALKHAGIPKGLQSAGRLPDGPPGGQAREHLVAPISHDGHKARNGSRTSTAALGKP
jgi:predicted metalloendopeptidase